MAVRQENKLRTLAAGPCCLSAAQQVQKHALQGHSWQRPSRGLPATQQHCQLEWSTKTVQPLYRHA